MRESRFVISAAFLSALFLLSCSGASAQDAKRIVIPLSFNMEVEQFSGHLIASRADGAQMSYTSASADGVGQAPGKVLFRLEPVDGSPNTYRLFVDSNSDGDLRNDRPQTFIPNSSTVAKINRKWANGSQLLLPYSIQYSREADSRGQIRERFSWLPHYRADGRLKVGKCESLFALLDLSGDGQFDKEDVLKGTSIGLDRDGDGRIWGKDEYINASQIIEFCGERFLVDAVAVDGTSVTLVKTSLRVPKLDEQLPEFSLTTVDGQTLESKSLRNKIHLFDFWASWCKPCVEKFGLVKKIADEFKVEISVIAINVDEESLLPNARQIIKNYGLTWPHVMSGRGEADPLWKMFGGMEGNRLSIPLYVLVDSEGRLRYAANGGEDLSELRTAIRAILK